MGHPPHVTVIAPETSAPITLPPLFSRMANTYQVPAVAGGLRYRPKLFPPEPPVPEEIGPFRPLPGTGEAFAEYPIQPTVPAGSVDPTTKFSPPAGQEPVWDTGEVGPRLPHTTERLFVLAVTVDDQADGELVDPFFARTCTS